MLSLIKACVKAGYEPVTARVQSADSRPNRHHDQRALATKATFHPARVRTLYTATVGFSPSRRHPITSVAEGFSPFPTAPITTPTS